jgi:hypothetical protein
VKTRSVPLSHKEQQRFLHEALPGRIAMIRQHLGNRTYPAMMVVALGARAVASFLGISRDRHTGELFMDERYYEHQDNSSYEVKIADLSGGRLVDPRKLPKAVQQQLAEGILEANVGFARLTFWSSSVDQTSSAAPTQDFLEQQYLRVQKFGEAVIALWEIAAKTITI